MEGVSRAEWRWVALISLAVVLVSAVPYAAGYLSQTPQMRFSGAIFDREDYHSYLGRMWQGYRGECAFRLLFTPEEHRGACPQVFYIALGHLARLLGLSLPLTYQLARMAGAFLLLLTVYRFIAWFAAEEEVRRAIFLLAVAASGLGWLTELLSPTPAGGISPIDFWLIDAYLLFSLLLFPHFSVAAALLLMLYHLLFRVLESPTTTRRREAIAAVVISIGLGTIHPHALLLADLVPGLYLLWRMSVERRILWPPLLVLLAMGLAQAPLVLYDYWVMTANPVFRAWAERNVTLSPPPRYYLLGYGPLLLLGLGGLRAARRATRRSIFLLIWVTVVFVAAYLPWKLQRRFVEGVQVALSVPAGYGLVAGLRRIPWSPLRHLAAALVLTLASLSHIYILTADTLSAATRSPGLFHPADEVAAVEWLGSHSTWRDTVLASYETGNWLVGAIGHRVVLGHWCETAHSDRKGAEVRAFFSGEPGFDRCGLLTRYAVAYVFYGPQERRLGDGTNGLVGVECISPVLWSGDVVVYRVTR